MTSAHLPLTEDIIYAGHSARGGLPTIAPRASLLDHFGILEIYLASFCIPVLLLTI